MFAHLKGATKQPTEENRLDTGRQYKGIIKVAANGGFERPGPSANFYLYG